jgi:hypothetical protein
VIRTAHLPFHTLKKMTIEPELWPRLREYISWVRWLAKVKGLIKQGVINNKALHTKYVAKELDSTRFTVVTPSKSCHKVRLKPSKEATFRISD